MRLRRVGHVDPGVGGPGVTEGGEEDEPCGNT